MNHPDYPCIPAKTIVSSYFDNGWFGSNYNMNIYKGCSHDCIYCDSRSECYQIQDFDVVKPKANALDVIDKDLRSKRKSGIIITGSMSDAYNPLEKELLLTRGVLKLIAKHGFGVVIDTKSDLVLRDIALLKSIRENSPVVVNFTITCADDDLCRKIERNVCLSSARFSALERLSKEGINCGVLLMPILPFINDTNENITEIIRRAAQAGAKWISVYPNFGVTLRQNQRDWFFKRLDENFPGKKEIYMKTFGNAYECETPNQKQLTEIFRVECEKAGLLTKMEEISAFIKRDYTIEQIVL
ncbi:MAG: radical SAM protein [Oscillospiraceae bacterium]|nr:radical SAM protein [Oscillospiraceae bacterium]